VGLGYHPDLIVLTYFINDAEPIVRRRPGFLIRHSWLYAFIASRVRRLPLRQPGAMGYEAYYRRLYQGDRPGWLAVRKAFRDLAQMSRGVNIPVIVFLLPELRALGPAHPLREIHRAVDALGDDVGLPVIDLWGRLARAGHGTALFVTPSDPHPSGLAHAVIGQAIHEHLATAKADALAGR
jgi:hypothetical protein